MSNEIISNFWKKATAAEKCEEAGLWGLITSNEEVELKPKKRPDRSMHRLHLCSLWHTP